MADLVVQNDTVRWIACKAKETYSNGDVVEVFWENGVAYCCRVTGQPGREVGVVENNTNNSLSTITAGAVGDVQIDGAVASVKKLAADDMVSGYLVDYVVNETYCVPTAGLGPKNLMKLSASAGVGSVTCAGTLSAQLRKEFNSLATL